MALPSVLWHYHFNHWVVGYSYLQAARSPVPGVCGPSDSHKKFNLHFFIFYVQKLRNLVYYFVFVYFFILFYSYFIFWQEEVRTG